MQNGLLVSTGRLVLGSSFNGRFVLQLHHMRQTGMLEENKKIDCWLVGDMDDKTVEHLFSTARKLMDEKKRRRLCVGISSNGGFGYVAMAAWNLFSELRQDDWKIVTFVPSYAASTAAVVFLGGDERILGKNGYLMLHQETVPNSDIQLHGNTASYLQELQIEEKVFLDIYKNVGIDEKRIEQIKNHDTVFSFDECVSIGMATGVGMMF